MNAKQTHAFPCQEPRNQKTALSFNAYMTTPELDAIRYRNAQLAGVRGVYPGWWLRGVNILAKVQPLPFQRVQ
jgi:hypothetical protein